MIAIRSLCAAAIVVSLACATNRTRGLAYNPNLITQHEIESIKVADAYGIVERLRPEFFRVRGHTSIVGKMSDYANVYLGGHLYGDVNSLKTITYEQVREIRYWNANDASLKFGMANSKGVIQVFLR